MNLYTAIVTDTGSFRYSNTTPKTFRVAARLVEVGVDPAHVATTVYETRAAGRAASAGPRSSRGSRPTPMEQIAWLVIDRALAGSPDLSEAEEFVNYPRSVRTAKVAVLFRELPDCGEGEPSRQGRGGRGPHRRPPGRRRPPERGRPDPAGEPG